MPETKKLQVFLCHASADKPKVRELYKYLRRRGINPWLDIEDLAPGQNWQVEIPKALYASDVIIVCLSGNSVTKEGYVQKEIVFALDKAQEKPEGTIFIIPAKLEECDVPDRLNAFQWVDLHQEGGYPRLMRGLKLRAEQLARARVEMPKADESSPDLNPGASVSVGKDVRGNIIVGDHNVIQVIAAPQAQIETEKLAEQKAEQERLTREKDEAEKLAQEKIEQERLARGKQDAMRIPKTKTLQYPSSMVLPPNELLKQMAEQKRFAEKILGQKARQERVTLEKAENESKAREKAESERITRQRTETDSIAREKAESEQRARQQVAARAETWAHLKMPIFLSGALLLVLACCVALWLVISNPAFGGLIFQRAATISSVKMTADNAGANETTTFTPNQTFYCVIALANAPDTTKVKAVWSTVDDAGNTTQIAEKEIVGSASPIIFNASNNAGPWPAGKYRVQIYLNDRVDKTLDFVVSTQTLTPQATETLPSATFTVAPQTKIPVIPTPSLTPHILAVGAVMTSPIDGMNLHYVPAGPFTMGSDNGNTDEKPAHQVTLAAFWIDETEVTNKMYALCVKTKKCQLFGNKDSFKHKGYYDDPQYADYPVIYVSWNDATAYCSWAGRKLPSEAQWEKAARGPNGNIYPWGNAAPDKDLLNYNQNVGDTTKVGLYPNGMSFYGAYDMAGNVLEWVADWYNGVYYQNSPASNPLGPSSGQYRTLRGGAWNHNEYFVRSVHRNWNDPTYADYIGFRCALSQ